LEVSYWKTPEEIAWEKKRAKNWTYVLLPVCAIFLGAIIAIVAQ
jgi:glycerol uptake facilitator-like aquaporin